MDDHSRALLLDGLVALLIYLGPSIFVVIAVLRNRRRRWRILESGIPGWAVIERITGTGTTTPHGRVHKMELMIEPQGGASYPLKMKRALSGDQYALFWPGARVPIRIDPGNWRRIEFAENEQTTQTFYGPDEVRIVQLER